MDTQKQQIVDRLKQANNILVTVKSNPTVDHLAACIGLTLALNKLGKHATAVFSGAIPSTIEFLQPEKTLERNTDSLRDFIIALDKSKADKLRYKVEDKVVKIFITPYKTSISEKDLNFSQGDFNVDVVLALGVHQQADLDQAIQAHGRILHDATVASVTLETGQNLGTINWTKPAASSLSELAVEIMDGLDKSLLDGQIATAFLTGIVAETDRFSNNRTSPQTMSISAELMAVGANQQLVATKLAEPPLPPPAPIAEKSVESEEAAKKKAEDGTLEIEHDDESGSKPPQINIDEDGSLHNMAADEGGSQPPAEKPESAHETGSEPKTEEKEEEPEASEEKKEEVSDAEQAGLPDLPEIPKVTPAHSEPPHMILQPPTLGGQLTAAASSDFFDPLVDAAAGAPQAGRQPILSREPLGPAGSASAAQNAESPPSSPDPDDVPSGAPSTPPSTSAPSPTPVSLPTPVVAPVSTSAPSPPLPPPPSAEDLGEETLSDIERQLHSSHIADDTARSAGSAPPPASTPAPVPDVSDARDAVAQAVSGSDSNQPLAPIQALNAQPVNLDLHNDDAAPAAATPSAPGTSPVPAGPALSPAVIPNAAPFAPEGLTLPGVTGATNSPTTPPPAAPVDDDAGKQDPNAPPPVPPPMLPPLPS